MGIERERGRVKPSGFGMEFVEVAQRRIVLFFAVGRLVSAGSAVARRWGQFVGVVDFRSLSGGTCRKGDGCRAQRTRLSWKGCAKRHPAFERVCRFKRKLFV